MNTALDIDALERAALAATPGPWGHDGWMHVGAIQSDQLNGGYVIAECQGPSRSENMSHIAASNPATILELIRRIREVEQQRDELLAALEGLAAKADDLCGWDRQFDEVLDAAGAAIASVKGGAT